MTSLGPPGPGSGPNDNLARRHLYIDGCSQAVAVGWAVPWALAVPWPWPCRGRAVAVAGPRHGGRGMVRGRAVPSRGRKPGRALGLGRAVAGAVPWPCRCRGRAEAWSVAGSGQAVAVSRAVSWALAVPGLGPCRGRAAKNGGPHPVCPKIRASPGRSKNPGLTRHAQKSGPHPVDPKIRASPGMPQNPGLTR